MVRVKFCWDGRHVIRWTGTSILEILTVSISIFTVTLTGLEFLENIQKQEYFTIAYKCHSPITDVR